MSDPIISYEAFRWTLTVLTLLGAAWAAFDVVLITRVKPGDPLAGDKRFGYVTGIVIALFAVAGVLRFHDVL